MDDMLSFINNNSSSWTSSETAKLPPFSGGGGGRGGRAAWGSPPLSSFSSSSSSSSASSLNPLSKPFAPRADKNNLLPSSFVDEEDFPSVMNYYDVPEEYLRIAVKAPKLPNPHHGAVYWPTDLLFFFFYVAPKDELQMTAAAKLYERGWRYNMATQQWLARWPKHPPEFRTATMEKGFYMYQDVAEWKRVTANLVLKYDELAGPTFATPTHGDNQAIRYNTPSLRPQQQAVAAAAATAVAMYNSSQGNNNNNYSSSHYHHPRFMSVGNRWAESTFRNYVM